MHIDDTFPLDAKQQMDPQSMLLFMLHRHKTTSAANVELDKAAFAFWHRMRAIDDPLKHQDVSEVMRAMKRKVEVKKGVGRKAPLSPAQLAGILGLLRVELGHANEEKRFLALRDGALLTIGFSALLRAAELTSLHMSDVTLHNRNTAASHMEVRVRKSKTDPTARGQSLRVATPPDSQFRIDWWAAHLLVRNVRSGSTPEDHIFSKTSAGNKPLLKRDVANLIRGRVQQWARHNQVELRIATFAGHSLRRGGATAMAEMGISEIGIQQQGRWRSDAYKAYIEMSDTARLNASASWQLA